jgi:Tol biopolymer transport system component
MKAVIRFVVSGIGVKLLLSLSSCLPHDPPKNTPINYVIQGSQDTDPSFSPDGSHIAFAHWADTSKNYPNGLYIINSDGSNEKLVVAGGYFNSPSWSPDGQWLVFSSGQLLKCKTNGDSVTVFSSLNNLTYPEFYFPNWAKDGKHIVFDKPFGVDWGIYTTSASFQASGRFGGVEIFGRNPELSNDGNALLFEAGKGGAINVVTAEIFLFNSVTQNKIQLTNNGRDNRSASWSPDNTRIVWSSDVRLSIMNADGSNPKEIEYGNSPSWSINNEIVYSHANSTYSKEVLYIISPDGKNMRQITF